MTRWPRKQDARGTSSLIGTLMSAAIMGTATAGLITYSVTLPTGVNTAQKAGLDAQASTLSDVILGRPGANWAPGQACTEAATMDADAVTEFGLSVDAGCPGATRRQHIASEKLLALRSPALDAFAYNDLLDYEEAREALGVTDHDLQFRLSFEPVEEEFRQRVLYIGHYDDPASMTVNPPDPDDLDVPTPPTTTPTVSTPSVGLAGPSDAAHRADAAWQASCLTRDWCLYLEDRTGASSPALGLDPPGCDPLPLDECPPSLWSPNPVAVDEVRYLDAIAPTFSPYTRAVFYESDEIPHDAEGDVVPDVSVSNTYHLLDALTTTGPQGVLRATTLTYQVVVVGSWVDDNAFGQFTAGGINEVWDAAADLLADWVRVGGHLIVLGGDEELEWMMDGFQNTLFLDCYGACGDPGFHVADPEHRLLSDPYQLEVEDYVDHWGHWIVSLDAFDRVVDDMLYASRPGAFGQGTVVLVGWQSHRLDEDVGAACDPQVDPLGCEGAHVLANALHYWFERFSFDYGPPVPSVTNTGVVQRFVGVRDAAGNTLGSLRVYVHVWRGMWSDLTYHTFPFEVPFDVDGSLAFSDGFRLTSLSNKVTISLKDFELVSTNWRVEVKLTDPGGTLAGTCIWPLLGDPLHSPCQVTGSDSGLWGISMKADAGPGSVGTFLVRGEES